MKTSQNNTVYGQHEENLGWINKLFFYKDEIAIMQKRLEEIVKANTTKEVLAQVEHFQNQLIVQRNNIDTIKHDVNINESHLEKNINDNPVAVDHRKVEDHKEEREKVEAFEKNFLELRNDLKVFLAKWL